MTFSRVLPRFKLPGDLPPLYRSFEASKPRFGVPAPANTRYCLRRDPAGYLKTHRLRVQPSPPKASTRTLPSVRALNERWRRLRPQIQGSPTTRWKEHITEKISHWGLCLPNSASKHHQFSSAKMKAECCSVGPGPSFSPQVASRILLWVYKSSPHSNPG
jgi:hypothetical protein